MQEKGGKSNIFSYNWRRLYKLCKGNPKAIIHVLFAYKYKNIDNIRIARIIAELSKYDKPSFIRDLEGLLLDMSSLEDKMIYLYVASRRSKSDFLLYGIEYLHIDDAGVDRSVIEKVELFTIIGDYILFKY